MLHIILYHPEIPPNTGNIARLCAATGTILHLIEPLGFSIDDKHLKRAGLDYWSFVQFKIWSTLEEYINNDGKERRLISTSARHGENIFQFAFTEYDSLLFGPESSGLPKEIQEKATKHIRIPIRSSVRSLNLSTSAGIILYSALHFCDMLKELA